MYVGITVLHVHNMYAQTSQIPGAFCVKAVRVVQICVGEADRLSCTNCAHSLPWKTPTGTKGKGGHGKREGCGKTARWQLAQRVHSYTDTTRRPHTWSRINLEVDWTGHQQRNDSFGLIAAPQRAEARYFLHTWTWNPDWRVSFSWVMFHVGTFMTRCKIHNHCHTDCRVSLLYNYCDQMSVAEIVTQRVRMNLLS